MKGEAMEIALNPGGGWELKQSRRSGLGEVDQLLADRRVRVCLRLGVLEEGSAGKGSLNSPSAFLALKKGERLGRMAIDFWEINKLTGKARWEGN